MLVGTGQVDITPEPGVELQGFLRRTQPSAEVFDPLFCRALYLEEGPERFLWLHVDLIGLERRLVTDVRRWAKDECALEPCRVMLSATHTHSGPGVIHLTQCGKYNADYAHRLAVQLHAAARMAIEHREPCHVVAAEGTCELGVDRRKQASAHVDPQVGALGFRRFDGSFKAVLANYAMHPTAYNGRQISADWPGQAAHALAEALPGRPTVLMTLGACGNIDPPKIGALPEQVAQWGRRLAGAVTEQLTGKAAKKDQPEILRVASAAVPLPLETWSPADIRLHADRLLQDRAAQHVFGPNYRAAIEEWRDSMTERVLQGEPDHVEGELLAVGLSGTVFLGVNAEVFSLFTHALRSVTGVRLYTVSCANGVLGYLPTSAAYDEGGFEVEKAMVFYNGFRPRRGALGRLAEQAAVLVRQVA